MSFLPIVERELRTRARWSSTYWLRCLAALVASGIGVVMMVAALFSGPTAAGKTMFTALAWPAWLFCLLEGLRNTADCLSEEKRNGTLGLLFLTDLNGYDVVLGKFIGASVGAFFTLLATMPVLAIPMLWGGVTGGEFWRMALVLTTSLFFSLSAGIFVSAVSRQERRAWFGSLALAAGFTVVLPLLASLLGPAWGCASPWTLFSLVFDAAYRARPGDFWRAFVTVQGVGWAGLAASSFLLPRTWQERAIRAASPLRLDPRKAARRRAEREATVKAEAISRNPILWLATHGRRRGRLSWLPVGLAALLASMCWETFRTTHGLPLGWWAASIGLHIVLAMWVAWEACHAFGELRRTGMLELLLGTPLSLQEIVRGQELALRRLFLRPFLILAGAEILFLVASCWPTLTSGSTGNGLFSLTVGVALVAVSLTLFGLDLLAVSRVGLWLGLTSRKPSHAWGKTVLWVEALPLLVSIAPVFMCCGVATPFVLLAKSVIFFSWAHGKLQSDFRVVVAEARYAGSQSWWRWK